MIGNDDVSAGHGKRQLRHVRQFYFFEKYFFILFYYFHRVQGRLLFFFFTGPVILFFVSFVWQLDGERMSVIEKKNK